MKRFYFVAVVSIFMILSSCNKDDDGVAISDRSTALLGQWEYTAITTDRAVDLNGDNISNIDLFGTQELPQCSKDNITTYTESGPSNKPEYNVTENNLACDDNNPFSFVEEDFWSLNNNNSVISFENREPFRIVELTNTKLIIESDDTFEDMEYVLTISYKRK
ncbi:MAG: hypothetical protein HKN31_15680 [Pricia sp.]|nr:hypothetical protein [Pricia sp.]